MSNRPLSKVEIIGVLFGLLGIAVVFFLLPYLIQRPPRTAMLIDNATDSEVTAYLDNKLVGKVASHQYIRVVGKEGKHKIELKDSKGTVVDAFEITVVEAKKPFEKFCYVYNVQGRGNYIILSRNLPDAMFIPDKKVDIGSRFFKVEGLSSRSALFSVNSCDIDKDFMGTKNIRGLVSKNETHLCHVNVEKEDDFKNALYLLVGCNFLR